MNEHNHALKKSKLTTISYTKWMSAWLMYTSAAESEQVQLGIFTRHVGYYTYKKKWTSRDGNCDFKILRYCALVNCKNMLFSSLEHFTFIALI